jgi:RNA polymerase sigma-70 factor (sigma-E family)
MSAADTSFDAFAAANARGLMSTAFLICCNEDDAEDLVQECLWRVARRWRKVRAMEFPDAYARQIVVNLAIDHSGKAGRRLSIGDLWPTGSGGRHNAAEPADERSQDAIDAVASRAELLDALSALSRQQRAAVVLRYFNDLSEADTARILGCGVGTVKSCGRRVKTRPPAPLEN